MANDLPLARRGGNKIAARACGLSIMGMVGEELPPTGTRYSCKSEDSVMKDVDRSRGATLGSNWGLIAGALVIALLLVAIGYSFSPSYLDTATNTRASGPAFTTGSLNR